MHDYLILLIKYFLLWTWKTYSKPVFTNNQPGQKKTQE